MGTVFDLIGSYLFKAAMIGIIVSTSISLNQVMVEKSQLVNLEKNINVATSVLEWDIRNAGYRLGSNGLRLAQSRQVSWLSDVDNNGVVDSVAYTSTAYTVRMGDSTVTRYDVYRYVNGTGNLIMKRLNGLSFAYFDSSGVATSTLSLVRGIKVSIQAESPVTVNDRYLITRREFTIFPVNLMLS